jgi:hypothetical protein
MASTTIQLGSAVASAGLLAYDIINNDDVYTDDIQKITRGLFSGNAASLATFFTSSAQSASSGQYYYDVYDKVGSDSTREVQFSVAYGHALGSGSLRINATSNFAGSQDTPSRAIYAQYQQTLLPANTTKFNFIGVGNSATAGTAGDENSIYIINFKRARLKDKLDPGNWELTLRNSTNQIRLIDDSGDSAQISTADQEYYNVVSGSLSAGIVVPSTTRTYGRVYPKRGVIVLSGTQLDLAAPNGISANTTTTSNTNGNNAFKLFTFISASAANDSTNGVFKARNLEEVKSSYYFLRVRNSRFNFSNNPSYIATASNGSLTFSQPTFARDPKTYITTVGLFNDNNEMLAVGKLSQPILKSYANEILLKVKLDF